MEGCIGSDKIDRMQLPSESKENVDFNVEGQDNKRPAGLNKSNVVL